MRRIHTPSWLLPLTLLGALLAGCGREVLAPQPAPPVAATAEVAARVAPDTAEATPPPSTARYELGTPVPAPWDTAPVRLLDRPPPEIGAAAAVVLDEASLGVLYDHYAHERRAPASLTKIATAILAAERGDLEEVVSIDVDGLNMGRSTVMGLIPGDEFTLRDLLYGLMLPSGNDAALAIARHISGSEVAFAEEMTALAWRLGLTDSTFTNPHGLGGTNHRTTAYDLAVLSRYLMTFPDLAEIVAARSWTAEGSRTISMWTLNSLLHTYPGADGLKTGYTRRAGPTIAVSAVRDGHRLYVVVLDSPTREADAAALLDWAFESHVWPLPRPTRGW